MKIRTIVLVYKCPTNITYFGNLYCAFISFIHSKTIVVREAFFFCYIKYLIEYFVVRQESLSIVDQFDQKKSMLFAV